MSNENKQVIDMTATENENNVNDLLAERTELLGKIEQLEEKVKKAEGDGTRIYSWYTREKDKVRALAIIIKAMKSEYMSLETIVDNIVKEA